MNIFFGKISKLFDLNQIHEGYYMAPKGSSWFGDLNLGDYVYLIGGDKIQFWQAKEWGTKDGKECLYFDILNNDIGITVSNLIGLKFLKLTKSLLILTSRSAKNKAFFNLELLEDIAISNLSNSEFYTDQNLYRNIKIITTELVEKNSKDIQLIYENEELKLVDNDIMQKSIIGQFKDNISYYGKGAKMKDKVLDYFSNAIHSIPVTINSNDIGLRSFYDTFFCEYKESKKYYLVGAFWDTSNPQNQTSRFIKESNWINGYEDKFIEEVKKVPVGSEIAIKAAFVREKTKSVMTIKARGIVVNNHEDGRTLDVEWEEDFLPFEVPFGGYMSTIKEVTKLNHIEEIWFNNKGQLDNSKNENSINYWVFQGNPKVFDFETALIEGILTDWTVTAFKDKIKIGDKVILWIGGNNAGCYALAEITSEPKAKLDSPDSHLWKEEDKNILKAKIEITHNLVYNPINKSVIDSYESLKHLKVGFQGTNFSATKEEYETILALTNSNITGEYESIKKELDPEKLNSFLSILRKFIQSKNLKINDERISFNIKKGDNRLVFLIGNRYVLNIDKKNSKTEISFISNNLMNETIGNFFNKKHEIEAYWNKVENINGYESKIEEGLNFELNRNNKCPFRKFLNQDFINDIYQNNNSMEIKNTQQNISKNTILYGPPGTGKTYKLKNEYFSKYTLSENSISPEANFEDVVSGLTWWQVIALALLEIGTNKVNDILENRWVAKKAQLSESKNVRATIWGTLQMHTIQESETVAYSQRQTPLLFNKTDDKKWELLISEVKEQAPELIEILDSITNFKPNPNKEIKHYVFTTFHQSFSYEDFIEGIKPVMSEGQENVTYKIENGIFKELCLRAQNDPENRYAIFIDEINRGNVSQIFGELITLIEHDKRIGASNEIRVKLPYSKKEFGVPMNVDIIGTMNTADRSVEALDTALRRRFSFVEMMPDEKVIADKKFTDYDRATIMNVINQRIEVLLDRNYTLGHSYFIKADFKNSFENEIMPLLQEYFYNDYGKIGLVLGKGFVREKAITANNEKSIFADFDTKNEVDITKSYELIPFTEINFETAIQTLLA